MKQIFLSLAEIVLAFSVAKACLAGSVDEAPIPIIDLQLRWRHQFQFAGYYAAVERGYYREEGLTVRLHDAEPGKTPVDEVLSGRAQYGQSNSDILYARLQAKPVVALAAIFQHSPVVLLARSSSGIRTPHDLIGRRVMLLNPQSDAYIHAMLRNEGIGDGAVNIVPSSLNFEDLLSDRVDAFNSYITNETFVLKQRGIAYNVINPATYGIDFYSDILFTTEREVESHPERVTAVLRATLKGWRYAMDHPEDIIDLLITKYQVPHSREHLQYEADAMRSLILPDLIEIGHMNPGRWERMAKAYIDSGMGNQDFSLDGFIYDPNPPNQIAKLKKTIIVVSSVGGVALMVAGVLLCGWLRLKCEIKLRKIAEAEVKQLAYIDPLTGISNRNSFMPYANKQIHSAQRKQQKIAFCFIDLNNFKEINDNYGHKIGDAILMHAANAITSVIRESDLVARIGGDEFVVLLTGIQDSADTRRTTREIQHAIATAIVVEGFILSITASIGIAIYPDDGEHLDDLISTADTEMFQEKKIMKVAEKGLTAGLE